MTPQQIKAEHVAEMLNDLVKINTDRVARYQKALDQANLDSDLACVFKNIVADSIKYKNELKDKMNELGVNPYPILGSISGQIHRAWSDLSVALSTNTRKAIMSSCQYNEDIAQHAYTAALSADFTPFDDIRQLIETQQKAMKTTSERIKKCNEEYYVTNTAMRSFQYSPMMF
ncbi:MAG: PA2169 family four-helix-bundle protein [Flavipsychrobacter sp.]|nr:PA2169 family four-helix-bundle protein [Flavipsychrobacter sp.]